MKKTLLLFAMTCMTIMASATTYALYGTVPAGASDLTAKVSAAAVGTATWSEGVFTGAGMGGRICQGGNYLKLSVAEPQTLSLTGELALHIVLQRSAEGAGNVQVALCNNGWNDARAGWTIDAKDIVAGEDKDIVLKMEDRVTSDWNSFNEGNLYGENREFKAEILRLAAADGEAFAIKSIYVESAYVNPDEPTEIPEQDAQRIYIRKGTAITPEGVKETADYSATLSLASEFWNCTPKTEPFFGITTNTPAEGDWDNGWWFNCQLKSSEKADLTCVFATWSLVMKVKNEVVEEGTDRGLEVKAGGITVEEGGEQMHFVSTYAERETFVEHVMYLKTILKGAAHLKAYAPGATILDFSSTNDHTGDRNIEIDYIYLTNELPVPTAIENEAMTEIVSRKVMLDGRVLIEKAGVLYDLMGNVVK